MMDLFQVSIGHLIWVLKILISGDFFGVLLSQLHLTRDVGDVLRDMSEQTDGVRTTATGLGLAKFLCRLEVPTQSFAQLQASSK